MKVRYKGRFRAPSISLNGVVFMEGQTADVTPEWFESCKNPNVVEVKARKKRGNGTPAN